MAQHNDLGKLGEEEAVKYLKGLGYEILDLNWTYDKAEIDIIAKKDETLAIIEVKTRTSADFGNPQDFVNPKKIKLLVKAVNEYVTVKNLDLDIRFDIISVLIQNNQIKIEFLTDAFYYFY
ncbi:Protein of unknown function [Flavobacterium indicum GPTSA100-9 = DSM 17447]|uniref:UPF0102 protein KQS_12890 n=1 Tax=Flavobacterium indicum (strain DSM 17447 / CIP 109464 / GPTSA100-9) TaxID=1094466 RepID=H8XRP7_FLAIG|nr:YraN family protein [Flavobacterium indicum]CCG54481.1 Protein of unknown function [Flavobacterium indicum GPTSA100-9 = DSM 17447]